MKIKVSVTQTEKRSYFDDEKGAMTEYDAREEVKGVFSDWQEVEAFTTIVVDNFPNAVVNINIEREAE